MRPTRILLVIFMSSLLLFLPLVSSTQNIKLFPFENENVIINVKSPTMDISTDIKTGVELSLYYLDPINDDIISLANLTIFGEATLEFEKRGNYLLQMFAFSLGDVQLDQKGIYFSSPFIIFIIGMANVVYRFVLRYRNVIEY